MVNGGKKVGQDSIFWLHEPDNVDIGLHIRLIRHASFILSCTYPPINLRGPPCIYPTIRLISTLPEASTKVQEYCMRCGYVYHTSRSTCFLAVPSSNVILLTVSYLAWIIGYWVCETPLPPPPSALFSNHCKRWCWRSRPWTQNDHRHIMPCHSGAEAAGCPPTNGAPL